MVSINLRVRVQLALGYIEFFTNFTEMMERIVDHLKYLSEYGPSLFQGYKAVQEVGIIFYSVSSREYNRVANMDDRGTQVFVKAYCDLLELFIAVRGVFTNKEGQISCKPYPQAATT